jgi:hypothetical protein
MQQLLKQSTAATTIVGPILDSTGAVYTGAVIGDLNITKNGTTAAMAAAATLTHDHNGHYLLVFTTGNTDTLGRLDITCNKSTYAMPPKAFEVLSASTFDAIVTNAATAAGGLQDVQRINGVAASSVTTINANLGTTQPENFTGTGASALVKVDMIDAASVAVTLDANSVLNVSSKYWAGTAITATSIPVATAAGASGGLLISGSNSGTTTFGALTVTGATTLTGAVSLGSTLGVTGTVTFNAFTVTNATTLSGAVSLGSTLTVTGTTSLAALTTSGTTTLNALTVTNALTVSGTTTLTGAVAASNASNNIVGIDVAKIAGTAYASSELHTLASHDPGATLASQTNITGGTITTATNVTTVNGLAAGVITATSIAADAITAAKIADGAIDRATFAADTGLQTIRSGTCQASGNTTSTVKLDAGASSIDNYYGGCQIKFTGGTGAGQERRILTYDGTTKIATIDTDTDYGLLATAADGTTTFAIYGNSMSLNDMNSFFFNGDGRVTVKTNNDKTGYSLTQAFPTNFAALAITAGGIVSADLQTIKTQSVTCAAGVTILASVGTAATSTAQTGDSYAIVNSGTFGNAAIKGYVDDIGVAGAGLTALGDTRIANLDAAISSRMATYTQPTGFLAATFPTTVASTTNITGGVITTVTNLTNAPTAGDLTATMKTSVATAVDASTAAANVSTILGRITSTLFSGITSLAQWLGALGGKQTGNSTARTEIRATGAGSGTFDETTDSLEAVRDRGDSAWGSSGGTVVLAASQPNYAPAKAGDAMTLTSAYDLWTADVKLNRDDVNSKDEWTCIVSKNGVVQDTLTAVSIRIGHRDGSAFIGSTALTAGSDGITWRKDFTTSNRLTAGEDVAVFITATDSLSAQHVCKVIAPITGRDSTT